MSRVPYVVVIVNGDEVAVAAGPYRRLDDVRQFALKESGNTGRPVEEWEVRTPSGELLDVNAMCGEIGLRDGDRLILCLQASAGGEVMNYEARSNE